MNSEREGVRIARRIRAVGRDQRADAGPTPPPLTVPGDTCSLVMNNHQYQIK